jgi:mycobactin salicyl-AMP ligase
VGAAAADDVAPAADWRGLDERGVAAHSRPDVLVPMNTLPTTAVGKVDKKAIVKQLGS